jgi:hypothetical protein
MSFQVKKSRQCQLRDKKHQYFSIVSLPTDSVIVDHGACIHFCNDEPTGTFFLLIFFTKYMKIRQLAMI